MSERVDAKEGEEEEERGRDREREGPRRRAGTLRETNECEGKAKIVEGKVR